MFITIIKLIILTSMLGRKKIKMTNEIKKKSKTWWNYLKK